MKKLFLCISLVCHFCIVGQKAQLKDRKKKVIDRFAKVGLVQKHQENIEDLKNNMRKIVSQAAIYLKVQKTGLSNKPKARQLYNQLKNVLDKYNKLAEHDSSYDAHLVAHAHEVLLHL